MVFSVFVHLPRHELEDSGVLQTASSRIEAGGMEDSGQQSQKWLMHGEG